MTVPDRSELPQEFVAYLEKQNAELAEHERPKPILPAEETPEELVDAAIALEEAIDRHIADGSFAAKLIEHVMRPTIDQALNREITEPIPNLVVPNKLGDTDLYEPRRKDLEKRYYEFATSLKGSTSRHQRTSPLS